MLAPQPGKIGVRTVRPQASGMSTRGWSRVYEWCASRIGRPRYPTTKASLVPTVTVQSKECAGLLDLPTELLVLIIEDVVLADLYSLALVSRRLHYLCLPRYLEAYGIREPFDFCNRRVYVDSKSVEVVSALRVALFIKFIRHLVFTVSASEGSECVHSFRRVGALLSEASLRLYGVTIRFTDISGELGGCEYESILFSNYRLKVSAMEKILDALTGTFCATLTVKGGMIMVPSLHKRHQYRRHLRSLLQRPVGTSSITTVSTQSLTEKFPRSIARAHRRADLRPFSTLTTLHARSPYLFVEPILSWTIATLNSASIVTLSIGRFDAFGAWDEFLSCLALPSLATLEIHSDSLLLSELLAFLSRHPTVVELNLAHSSPRVERNKPLRMSIEHPPPSVVTSFRFPLLKKLVATPDYIALLLSLRPQIQGNPVFRSLTTFVMEPYIQYVWQPPLDCDSIDCALGALASLCVPMRHPPEVTLCFRVANMSTFSAWLSDYLDLHRLLHPPRHTLNRIHHLKLLSASSDDTHPGPPFADVVPRWLATFPELMTVSFSRDLMKALSPLETSALFSLVKASCPRVREVWIDKVRWTWRDSAESEQVGVAAPPS
jgi:hypothetical protein